MHQIADDAFLVTGTHVNWILIRDGADLTLIDSGYPGDYAALLASVDALGRRPEDIRAVLLTHAHIDHVGGAARLWQDFRVPTWASAAEMPNATGEDRQQAGPLDVAKRAWRPRYAAWAMGIVRAGGAGHVSLTHAEPIEGSGPLDLPGSPRPIAVPGHTDGSLAFELPDLGVVATGDALATGHTLSRTVGPQLLPAFFAHDPVRASEGLDALRGLSADTVLPGHGPAWRGSMTEAVERARAGAEAAYRP